MHPAALIHLMKNRALKKCKDEQKAYADCVRGRGISLARARALACSREAICAVPDAAACARRRCGCAARALTP